MKEPEWKIIKPKVAEGNNGAYEVKHLLPGLEPGSYETRVRSRNSHGWSEFSEVMPFEGGKRKKLLLLVPFEVLFAFEIPYFSFKIKNNLSYQIWSDINYFPTLITLCNNKNNPLIITCNCPNLVFITHSSLRKRKMVFHLVYFNLRFQ